MLFVDAQGIGRRRRIGFHVIVELEAIGFAQVARLADPQDYRFQKAIEPAEHLNRRGLLEVPCSNGVLHRFKQRILADALLPAENKCVIDLLLWPLNPVREEVDDVVGFIGIDETDVINPSLRLGGVA